MQALETTSTAKQQRKMNPENIENHKWEKGVSGNPHGRPIGSRSLSTILQEMLDEEILVNEGGEQTKKALSDVIIRKLIRKAHDGDIRAIHEIFDRIEGKAIQKVDQKNSEPLVIRIIRDDD